MNRIDRCFADLKREGRKAFIAYVTAGDPAIASTPKIAKVLASSGVDIIELGIPFSDPIADGPVIQAASARALSKGASMKAVFAIVRKIRKDIDTPVVFMTYYNPILAYGIGKFMGDCARSGVDGVIVPDLPLEEAGELISYGRSKEIATIFLVAPTTSIRRMKNISDSSRGFIYYVSVAGVTGARKRVPKELFARIKSLKRMTHKPISVGFGISSADDARSVAKAADGVIVGSAIVRMIGEYGRDEKMLLKKLAGFSKKIAKAVHGA